MCLYIRTKIKFGYNVLTLVTFSRKILLGYYFIAMRNKHFVHSAVRTLYRLHCSATGYSMLVCLQDASPQVDVTSAPFIPPS